MLQKEELKPLSGPGIKKKKKKLEEKWRRQLICMSGVRNVIIVA